MVVLIINIFYKCINNLLTGYNLILLLGNLLRLKAPLEQHHEAVGDPHAQYRAPEAGAASNNRLEIRGYQSVSGKFAFFDVYSVPSEWTGQRQGESEGGRNWLLHKIEIKITAGQSIILRKHKSKT